ncbi:MAG: hypothetical protein LBQ00_06955 [Syntrophobacterales bacterium]|nr:hypothetical protein [Syntrophobacterales bacterium]
MAPFLESSIGFVDFPKLIESNRAIEGKPSVEVEPISLEIKNQGTSPLNDPPLPRTYGRGVHGEGEIKDMKPELASKIFVHGIT